MKINVAVPQVFYDLIARVVPGTTILLSSHIVIRGAQQGLADMRYWFGDTRDTPAIFVVSISVGLVVAGYLLAICMEGLLDLFRQLSKCIGRRTRIGRLVAGILHCMTEDAVSRGIEKDGMSGRRSKTQIRKDFDAAFGQSTDRKPSLPGIALMYDYVRMQDPICGARLVKLRAECRRSSLLVIGWGALAFLNPVSALLHIPRPWCEFLCVEVVLVAISFLMLCSLVRLRRRFWWGLRSHWLLLTDPRVTHRRDFPTS